MRPFLLAALAAAPLAAHATTYTFTTLDVPGAVDGRVYNDTLAHGLNDAGMVVGEYPVNSNLGTQGFLFDLPSNTYATISNPAANAATIATGINGRSQIVGYLSFDTGNTDFLRDPATGPFTSFTPSANAPYPTADGINDAGQIVGSIYGAGATTGFLRSATGDITPIVDPNATVGPYHGSTLASGINNAGLVVGQYTTGLSANATGFVLDPATGLYTDIRAPGAFSTAAFGINNLGQVVGTYTGAQGDGSFLLDLATGLYTTLADPDAVSTAVVGINDVGQFVGNYIDSDGFSHAFIATPQATAVAEPASIALLGGGVVALGLLRRRSKVG